MKTIITFALCLSLFSTAYSQESKTVNKPETAKIEELPEVIIPQSKKDFIKYIMDNNSDLAVKNVQNLFSSYKVDRECQNFDEYIVTFETRKGTLAAIYDAKGVLKCVSEKYANVELPREVINSVYISYPMWQITKSKFEYVQQEGQVLKRTYVLKLKKNNKSQSIIVSSNGEIIKTASPLAMN